MLSSTSIHALATELSLARARADSSKTTTARPRPSKSAKANLFRPNKGVSSRAARDEAIQSSTTTSLPASERELERSRRKMQQKAKLYAQLKRGDAGIEQEGLVDFDRKWAEEGSDARDSSSEDEEEAGDGADGDEVIEYEDEFGRTRTGKRSEVEREQRRAQAAQKHAGESTVRPEEPQRLIFGDTIQTHAFQTPTFSTVPSSDTLKRAMPTEEEDFHAAEAHYDASKEVRTKGVGFYQFSTDPEERKREMAELERQRDTTARAKKEKDERRKRKMKEIEERKELVRKKRRDKVGEAWLTGFMDGMAGKGDAAEAK